MSAARSATAMPAPTSPERRRPRSPTACVNWPWRMRTSVSQWPVLGTNSAGKAHYGGFVGFNTQWQDLILGFEANYNRTGYNFTAPNSPISRVTSAGGNSYAVDGQRQWLGDQSRFRLVACARRLGSRQLPALRFRAALRLAAPISPSPPTFRASKIRRRRPVPAIPISSPTCVAFDFPSSQQKNASWLLGFVVGGGVDVALTSNIFVRGEFEYARFSPVSENPRRRHLSAHRRRCEILIAQLRCRKSDLTAAHSRSYSHPRDTPPQRGAPIWKDRP